jgi:hypothetical protein
MPSLVGGLVACMGILHARLSVAAPTLMTADPTDELRHPI